VDWVAEDGHSQRTSDLSNSSRRAGERRALEFEQSYRHYHAAAEAYKRCDETDALRFATSHDPGELKSLVAETRRGYYAE
jgi:hypothetical protein